MALGKQGRILEVRKEAKAVWVSDKSVVLRVSLELNCLVEKIRLSSSNV